MLEMRLVVHGRVQGVGYRYSIIEFIEQNQLMVKGHVWNKPNGTVEILAQGDIETLKDIRRFAVIGSDRSVVRDIEEAISEISEYTYDSFDIKY
jgi:acylphosphatase